MNLLFRTIEILRITPGWVGLVYSYKKSVYVIKYIGISVNSLTRNAEILNGIYRFTYFTALLLNQVNTRDYNTSEIIFYNNHQRYHFGA